MNLLLAQLSQKIVNPFTQKIIYPAVRLTFYGKYTEKKRRVSSITSRSIKNFAGSFKYSKQTGFHLMKYGPFIAEELTLGLLISGTPG